MKGGVRRRLVIASLLLVAFTLSINVWDVAALLDAAIGLQWAAGIVAFMRTNTQGLLLMAALTLWYEFIGVERPRLEDREQRQALEGFYEAARKQRDGHMLVRIGLERAIPSDKSGDLSNLIAPTQGTLLACSVRISIRAMGLDLVEVSHQIEFSWDNSDFFYAIVGGVDELRVVNSVLPEVLETTVRVDPAETLDSIAARMIAHSPFKFISDDGSPIRNVPLKRVSSRKSRDFHQRLGTTPERLVMLQSNISGSTLSSGRLRVSHAQTHTDSTPYEWWMTDRPTYLQNIFIDASDLGPNRLLDDPILFVGHTVTSGHRPATNCWEATNVGWMVAGQGLTLNWRSVP